MVACGAGLGDDNRGGAGARSASRPRVAPLGRLGDRMLEAEPFDRVVAQLELLDLAGHGHRKSGNGHYVSRDLVVRDPATAEVAHALDVDRLAAADDHERRDLLSVALVGHTD